MRRAILIAALATSLSGPRWTAAQTAGNPAGDAETTAPAAESATLDSGEAGAASVSPGDSPGTSTGDSTTDPAKIEAQRAEMWNSREMTEARDWVLEYGRRSRALGEEGAQDYLARVQRLSPTQ